MLPFQVSLSAFAFLFSELVQYNQTRVDNIAELERRYFFLMFYGWISSLLADLEIWLFHIKANIGMMLSSVNGSSIVNESNFIHVKWIRLEDAGYAVGARVLELLCHRDKVQHIHRLYLRLLLQQGSLFYSSLAFLRCYLQVGHLPLLVLVMRWKGFDVIQGCWPNTPFMLGGCYLNYVCIHIFLSGVSNVFA